MIPRGFGERLLGLMWIPLRTGGIEVGPVYTSLSNQKITSGG